MIALYFDFVSFMLVWLLLLAFLAWLLLIREPGESRP